MTDPDVRQTGGEPPTAILPILSGDLRGERFVLSVDQSGLYIYIQFEGWVAEYPIEDMVTESFAEVWGNTATPDELEWDINDDTSNHDGN